VETDTRRLESFAVRKRIADTDNPARVQVDTDRKRLNYNIVLIFLILIFMFKFSDLTIEAAVANQGGAMEAETISKNGRSSKSQTSRGNNINVNKQ